MNVCVSLLALHDATLCLTFQNWASRKGDMVVDGVAAWVSVLPGPVAMSEQ